MYVSIALERFSGRRHRDGCSHAVLVTRTVAQVRISPGSRCAVDVQIWRLLPGARFEALDFLGYH